jgi:HSP20 family molecular chaperone IbpA
LPEEIDADNAKASIKNGILTIRLPKLAKSRVKKIKVMS